ncbi:GntR family transcriptional regulator [Paenibacillus baekrokdamisoli]|uniref:GntR family transcriptional regulator n=1 Tax=Paenibacillus baekrokdamisoli TaxID=1712516 RepID=A0A3G9JBB6_9BACL|nr:FadR/GntR family transcriptional regulator [Paenibacillus baekrokdamisoli]MBB3070137.1 DNA-binding FadR family transcriptional regulator [Paenibacillus baekrokdamisoli]BBH21148.1 GntR family transcriptional regulator [Paenibacillus baekrokdamisoli]
MNFQTLKRNQLVDEVVVQLQKKISSGDLKLGDKIPTEPELMEQFGVGRSTIREAVRVLVHAGMLEKKQGYGTFLTASSTIQEPLDSRLRRAELLEVYEVRRMLELEIAKLAAERRDEDDLKQMRIFLDNRLQAQKQRDMTGFLTEDIKFHLAIAIASKNTVVTDLYRTFTSVLQDALHKLVSDTEVHNPHDEIHENLYQAIVEKNAETAMYWTLQNLDGTVKAIKKALE